MRGESLGEYIRDPEEVDARNVAMRLAYNADRRRNTPLPVSAQEYEERKSSRGILFQGEGEIVDLTAEFKAKPTRQEIKEHLNTLVGKAFNTRTEGILIDILNSGKKKRHIIGSSAYQTMRNKEKKRHEAYVFGIEKLIGNAEYTGSAENRKSGKKPNVARYHYFEVPVRIGEHAWNVQLVCEEMKKEPAPQTATISRSSPAEADSFHTEDTTSLKNLQVENVEPVHLYDVLEKNILFQNTEEDEVRMKYAGTDSWMKAPNGKDTKLTEKQWLQVRTPSFKAWFGDWEGDPENASKAVDENGEPKVFYHNTNALFDIFDSGKNGSSTDAGWLGDGFYFYGDEQEGNGYGKNKMAVFLNVREWYFATEEENTRLAELDDREASIEFREQAEDEGCDGVYYNGDLRQEAVVFSPEQIKSATDNAGTFDPRNPSILFQIIGLSGASGLDLREDSADRAYLRQYNLTTAQGMEAAGKDAKAIRLATGWEKGADGKWKYEIPDGKLTGAQLRDEGGVPTAKLGELYDAPELYRAYPELRDVTVRLFEKDYSTRGFVWEGEIGLSGIFLQRGNPEELARAEARIREIEESAEWKELMRKTFEDKEIPDGELRRAEDEFNASPMGQERERLYDELAEKKGFYLKPEALPTLVHEIQHMIQDREGFAKGGNPEQFEHVPTRQKVLEALNEATEGKLLEGGPVETTPEAVFAALGKENSYGTPLIRYYGSGLDSLAQSYGYETVFDLVQSLPDFPESPDGLYRSLAGETEARTAAARLGLGAEERRGTLLAETADVPPEDQLILFQKAYHGSPYGFDSFSTDAIGSGEGHQAFGWGLYFTDNRGIAEGYAKKLAKPKVRYKGEDTETAKRRAQGTRTAEEREAGEKSAEEFTLGFIERLARNKALGLISDYKENIKKQIEFRENSLEGKGYPLNETEKRIYRKQIEALRNIDPEQIEILSVPRNLYTVDIPDGDYIKWDGPLTEGQKRKITEQARKEGVTDGRGEPFAYEEDGEWRVNTGASSSGEIFYRMELQGYFPDDKAKSLFLARAGIKGIDYPAGSLSAGAEGRNFVVFDATDVQVQSRILFQMEPVDDVQLREAISSVPHTEARRQYIRDIYESRKDSYETREFVSRDGKLKGRLEVYKNRDFKKREHEIDDALFFAVKGITVTLLAEGTVHDGKSVDALFNHETLVEFKRATGTSANGVANNIKDAANKMNSEVITVFFDDRAEGVGYEDVLERLEIKRRKGDLKGSFDRLIFVKDGKASLLKQNTAGAAFAAAHRNPNIAQDGGPVNRESAENTTFRESPEGSTRLLFQQTEKELLDDAASFDSWQDFMEFYESFGKPEDSIVPSGADETWYRTAWELARKRKAERETGMTAEDRDALFIREMEDGGLEDFLTETLHFYIFYVKYGYNAVPI